MTVKEIIVKYLKENGYDGLCNEDYCGCELKDLMPCNELPSSCESGYKIKCNCKGELEVPCPWHIVPHKPKE